MKYDVNFSCGHAGVVNLVGKGSDRERKINWYETYATCPECYAKSLAEQKAKEQNEIDTYVQSIGGLPALEGSVKQIAWAETLRTRLIKAMLDYRKILTQNVDKYDAILKYCFVNATSSTFYIDCRDETPGKVIQLMYKMCPSDLV